MTTEIENGMGRIDVLDVPVLQVGGGEGIKARSMVKAWRVIKAVGPEDVLLIVPVGRRGQGVGVCWQWPQGGGLGGRRRRGREESVVAEMSCQKVGGWWWRRKRRSESRQVCWFTI